MGMMKMRGRWVMDLLEVEGRLLLKDQLMILGNLLMVMHNLLETMGRLLEVLMMVLGNQLMVLDNLLGKLFEERGNLPLAQGRLVGSDADDGTFPDISADSRCQAVEMWPHSRNLYLELLLCTVAADFCRPGTFRRPF